MSLFSSDRSKAQSQVVTAVILSGIVIGGVSSAYAWGVPLLQKAQDVDAMKSSVDSMSTMADEIESIARRGGSSQVSFNIQKGSLEIDAEENEIIFQALTKKSYVSNNDWVVLNENDMQGIEEGGLEDSYGIRGRDKPGVLIARAVPQGDEFLTTLKIDFRELRDTQTGTHTLIQLEDNGNLEASEGQHNVVIQRGDEVVEQGGSKTGSKLVKQQILIRVN